MANHQEKWSIKKSASSCFASGYNFKDQDIVISQVVFLDGEYIRRDFCEKHKPEESSEISTWKTCFSIPIPKEDIVKKEGAEGLLRKFIKSDPEENGDIIFILAVMLERKKILIERDVKILDNGSKVRIYEHRETNESFMIIDPNLQLDSIDALKEEVAILLGSKPRSYAESTDDSLGS